MNDTLNISSKNSYLTSKQWKEVVEYVKNRKSIVQQPEIEEIIMPEEVIESQHSEAYEKIIQETSVSDMYMALLMIMNESPEKLFEMTSDELQVLYDTATQMNEVGPSEDYIDLADTLQYLAGEYDLNGAEVLLPTNNVHNVTKNLWYSTLSSAVTSASDGNTIEVYNSFTETVSVKIQKQNLTIRAAAGYNPIISWTSTDAVGVTGATSYHCVIVYTTVTTSTTFGGGTGVLTFNATLASDDDNKGKRARVMMHCGSGTLNLKDGIILTGGNTGGGSYESVKGQQGAGEIDNITGYGAGLYMYSGTLNMSGGRITNNYSLWGKTSAHSYVGGGGGVFLNANTTMNMSGGAIHHNAAGSGGGGGILVGTKASLTITGGTIIENRTNFASGGGIGIQAGYKKISISGGEILDNVAEGMGGGLFARGDADPIVITGGRISRNHAGSAGGGILFWTVGSAANNKLIISGSTEISHNTSTNGAGISIGREVQSGQAVGDKCTLEINGGIIEYNVSTEYGGGIYMQSDKLSDNVNSVIITSGIIRGNESVNGAGIYVPSGTVTMSNGTFEKNKSSNDGAAIFIEKGSFLLTNGTFNDNISSRNGGAVYIAGGNFTMNGGTLNNNSSEISGGAVCVTNGDINIKSGTISNNIALESGGAIAVTSGDVTIGIQECHDAGESSTHSHPVIESNIASDGGGIYVDGGITTMWCGDIKYNHTYEKTVNVLVISGGNFVYNGGTIGIPYDSGVFVNGGVFEDNSSESESVLKHELHYHSVLGDEIYNGRIPESKWIASPRGDVINVTDYDSSSVTWADLYPEYEFVGWESNTETDTDEVVNLYAIWEKK